MTTVRLFEAVYCPGKLSRCSNEPTGRPRNRGSIPIFFSSTQRPDRLTGSPILLSNGYRGEEWWSCTSTLPYVFTFGVILRRAGLLLLTYHGHN
jgi:hypothetical protein